MKLEFEFACRRVRDGGYYTRAVGVVSNALALARGCVRDALRLTTHHSLFPPGHGLATGTHLSHSPPSTSVTIAWPVCVVLDLGLAFSHYL